MTKSNVLDRLLHVLNIEEDIRRREFESADGELKRSERLLAAAHIQERRGRQMLLDSVNDADLEGRMTALEEVRAGRLRGEFFDGQIERLALHVNERRRALREKQVERKQTESLVAAADAEEALEMKRKTQQSLDQWFLRKSLDERQQPNCEKQEAKAEHLKKREGGSTVR